MWGNKGMHLEALIDYTNNYFSENNIALVNKMQIKLKLTGVTENIATGIIGGTCLVDYIGLHKGNFIAFEAKQTSKNNFSLRNIKNHQKNYLLKVNNLGGEAFIILFFTDKNEYYKISISQINFELKSLNYYWIKENCLELKIKHPMMLNYLST